jgi:RHH-type proline utilization regulon transcriptional repressor/proline dehydrogenase/delta 1-pyrroline-5-carboxylate dehydrogenase
VTGPIIPFIAETGGQNAMIVDSSALPEQVTRDVVASAFQSAGQRCSALRVLFVQDDVADSMLEMIAGAMQALTVGDPADLRTDVGPVIDDGARAALQAHLDELKSKGRLLAEIELPESTKNGHFIKPSMYEISSLAELDREHFGPVLHVVRWKSGELDKVIGAINATGYGLTLACRAGSTRRANMSRRMPVSAIYTSTATRSAQWLKASRSAGKGCPAPGPRPVDRIMWLVLPRSA